MARRSQARKAVTVTPGGATYLRGVYLDASRVPDGKSFPFDIPALTNLDVRLDSAVTFLVGENGSGKSTLLEAIAVLARLPVRGGSRNELSEALADPDDAGTVLARALRPNWALRPDDAFFFRSEMHAQFASLLEARKADREFMGDPYARYGGKSLHARSHGEAFLATFDHRLGDGLWLLDEPEAALSPQRQLALLALVWDRARSGATQIIAATHSPILLTYPGARILFLDETGIRLTTLEETLHFQITRGILASPEAYWRHLRAPDAGERDGVADADSDAESADTDARAPRTAPDPKGEPAS